MKQPIVAVEKLSKRFRTDKPLQRTLRSTLDWFWSRLKAEALMELSQGGSPVSVLKRRFWGEGGGLWALREVSFEVFQGEIVGLVGQNGSGKSTLLRVLSRITEPTSGCAIIRGRVASLLEVGTGFHPDLTGRENIYLSGAMLGMNRISTKKKFDEIVSFAELDRYIDLPVKRYSSGQYLRLAFSIAAHLEPEIVFVDEVFAVGDVPFQEKCLKKTEQFARQGGTVVLVSHNPDFIKRLCHRCLLLQRGQLIRVGSAEEILSVYSRQGASTPGASAHVESATA